MSEVVRRNIFYAIIIVVIFSLVIIVNCKDDVKKRIRRQVVFTKSSKFFFRLNGKDQVFNKTDMLAHGWTMRINYELPSTVPAKHKFFKRDIHDGLENIPNRAASKGLSCVLKHFCNILPKTISQDYCGVFCEIGKIIESSRGLESEFFQTFLDKCDFYRKDCPEDFHMATSLAEKFSQH